LPAYELVKVEDNARCTSAVRKWQKTRCWPEILAKNALEGR